MPKPTRCTLPSVAARLTGLKRPDPSFTMSMPRDISLASKSCQRARFWHPGTGKKLARRKNRTSAPPNSVAVRLLPGLRDPRLLAEIRREAALMSPHPEDEAINDWIEAVSDWDSWN